MFALSYSSVLIIVLTSSGGWIVDIVSGRIKDLRVDHQSIDKSVRGKSFSANFALNDCFASRISFTTLLHIFLNFCQYLSKFDLFALLYARLRFRICHFNEEVTHGGYIVLMLRCLFGINTFTSDSFHCIV